MQWKQNLVVSILLEVLMMGIAQEFMLQETMEQLSPTKKPISQS